MTREVLTSPTLSFDFLEDVLSLPPSKYELLVRSATVEQIGPVVEYVQCDPHNGYDRIADISDSTVVRSLSEALQLESLKQAKPDFRITADEQLEFFRTPQSREEVEDSRWLAFTRRLTDAGQRAGLSKKFSQALSGTFGEMVGNVIQHSDHAHSGLAGYRWTRGRFEYFVLDNGIGVFNSLRKHIDYSFLVDAGQALDVAIRDGESEYGRQAHKGTGFHKLTTNIALRNSTLRFRSDDHSLTIDGSRVPILKKIQHCSKFTGFLISITSEPIQGLTDTD